MLALLPQLTSAQYFGRNKIQYDRFDFQVMQSEHFHVHYYPEKQRAALDATRMLERWHHRLSPIFGISLQRQPIILYANHADFQQTNVIGGIIPQGVGGVTEGLRNRVVLPLTGVYPENDHVLGHELVHAFQYALLQQLGVGVQVSQTFPLWFMEGMAEYLSIGSRAPLTSMWMRDAVFHNEVPTFSQMTRDPRYFPYRFGHSVLAYVGGRFGDEAVGRLYRAVGRYGWERGFRISLNLSPSRLSDHWQSAVRDTYAPQLEGRTPAAQVGSRIITGRGGINLAPVLSPKGDQVAFLSSTAVGTIDLFIADARTGRSLRRLVRSETDEHFDALRFINSAGAWSPDGSKFVFIVLREGMNQLSILDVESRNVERTFVVDGVEDISHVSWSPDGTTLALSGTTGGSSDLYLYELSTGSLRKLTDDRYADLQPNWSPDGQQLVFATDRGEASDLDRLSFAPMRLGIIDIATGTIQVRSLSPVAKHINPNYATQGNRIYFVADPDGFSDIYSYLPDENRYERHTTIVTGITGLTELSPALSVSSESGRLAFTVFDRREYSIHSLDPNPPAVSPGPEDIPTASYVTTVTLAPALRRGAAIDSLMARPGLGLPPDTALPTSEYRPQLGLTYIGQLGVGLVSDQFGTGLAGALSLLFSDMLGDNLLGVSLQVGGGLRDIGGEVAYLNQAGRLNWGGSVGRIPYLSSRAQVETDTVIVEGQPTVTDRIRILRERVYDNRAMFIAEYPFTVNRRLEFSGGVTLTNYSTEEEIITAVGGQVVEREQRDAQAPSPLYLAQASGAYVGDFSFFGLTGPVDGSRYRLELQPAAGTLNFVTALADYRRYLFFNPVTIAARAYHLGRYLGQAEDERISPFYLGLETWIRGYSIYSFTTDECTGTGDNCPEFDRLIGSRVAVANVEVRLPVLGTERLGLLNFPYLPFDILGFFDAGVAWTGEELPSLRFDRDTMARVPVFSTGMAGRLNLFGLIVLQVYYAYPFQRPVRGAHWGFFLAPGW